MARGMTKRSAPRGLARLAFRLPIWLYHLRLGWLLGDRVLLLTHIGRKSGLPRQAVIEVVRHDPASDTYIIASGLARRWTGSATFSRTRTWWCRAAGGACRRSRSGCRSTWRRTSCTAMLSGTRARSAQSQGGCSAGNWMAAPSRVGGWRPMYPWSRCAHTVEPVRCIDMRRTT
jgi:hypothetical protein